MIASVVVAIAVSFCATTASAADGDNAANVYAGATDAAAPGGMLEAALFYAIAFATIVSALGVCFSTNVVRMAVWLFMALGSVATLYFLLAATFLGAIQLIVYVGGTLILLIFGVMLTSKSPWSRWTASKKETAAAAIVCGSLTAALCLALTGATWYESNTVVSGTAIAEIGWLMMTTYLVPFEVAGVLLMIVMVGAAHLARQEQSS